MSQLVVIVRRKHLLRYSFINFANTIDEKRNFWKDLLKKGRNFALCSWILGSKLETNIYYKSIQKDIEKSMSFLCIGFFQLRGVYHWKKMTFFEFSYPSKIFCRGRKITLTIWKNIYMLSEISWRYLQHDTIKGKVLQTPMKLNQIWLKIPAK